MPSVDLERLVVSLEASITKYEKAMQRAAGVSDSQARKVEARWKKLNIGGNVFAGFARGAIQGLLPVLTLAAAINKAKEGLKEFGDIADNARASGLDPEFFQGLTHQFQLAGIEIGQSAGALAIFAKNAGLAVAGKGKMIVALKALNPQLLENIRHARNQEERIRLVADALSKEEDASKRAAIATALFGDAGAKIAGAFAGGSAAIDETMRKAREMGLIVDRELIAKADKLGDEFDTATKIVGLELKQALINLAPILVDLAGLAADIAGFFNDILEGMKELEDRSHGALSGRLGANRQEQQAIQGRLNMPQGFLPEFVTAGFVEGEKKRLQELEQEERSIIEILRRRGLANNAPRHSPAGDDGTLDDIDARNKAAEAALRQAEATRQLIGDLQFERQVMGLSTLEQQILTAQRQAGVEATSRQGEQIRALVTDIEAEKTAADRLEEVLQGIDDIAGDVGRGLAQAFEDGKVSAGELNDILIEVLKQAALLAIANLIPGGNLLAPLLSGIIGGFDEGGFTGRGGKHQPAGVVHRGEFVFDSDSTRRIGVANLSALQRGYAGGGLVGGRAVPGGGFGGALDIRIGLDDELLNVRIDNRAAGVSARVTQAGLGTYDRSLAGRSAEHEARFR